MTEASPPAWLRPHPKGCTIAVRIQPGAKRSVILSSYGEGQQSALKIAIQAPPIEGRANEALITFLAQRLGLAKSRIEMLSGQSSRSKSLLLRELAPHEAYKVLTAR